MMKRSEVHRSFYTNHARSKSPKGFILRIAHIIALILVTGSPTAFAQSVAPDIAKSAVRGKSISRPTIEQLCAKLTLEKVQAIMGKDYQRREKDEALFQECRYGDSKEKGSMPVRYFSLGSYFFTSKEAGWRKEIEGNGNGKVTACWWAIGAAMDLGRSILFGSRIDPVNRFTLR
jgi:hypothetical protein